MKERNLFKSTLISSGVFVAATDSSRFPRLYVQLLKDTKLAFTLCKKERKKENSQRNRQACTRSAADIR